MQLKKYWEAALIPLSPIGRQLALHISSMPSCNMVSKWEVDMHSHFRCHHSFPPNFFLWASFLSLIRETPLSLNWSLFRSRGDDSSTSVRCTSPSDYLEQFGQVVKRKCALLHHSNDIRIFHCQNYRKKNSVQCFFISSRRLPIIKIPFFPSLEKFDPLERLSALCPPTPPPTPRIDLNRWILITIKEKIASVLCLPCLCTARSQLLWLPV